MATKAENEANMRFFGSILGVVLLSVFLINTVMFTGYIIINTELRMLIVVSMIHYNLQATY